MIYNSGFNSSRPQFISPIRPIQTPSYPQNYVLNSVPQNIVQMPQHLSYQYPLSNNMYPSYPTVQTLNQYPQNISYHQTVNYPSNFNQPLIINQQSTNLISTNKLGGHHKTLSFQISSPLNAHNISSPIRKLSPTQIASPIKTDYLITNGNILSPLQSTILSNNQIKQVSLHQRVVSYDLGLKPIINQVPQLSNNEKDYFFQSYIKERNLKMIELCSSKIEIQSLEKNVDKIYNLVKLFASPKNEKKKFETPAKKHEKELVSVKQVNVSPLDSYLINENENSQSLISKKNETNEIKNILEGVNNAQESENLALNITKKSENQMILDIERILQTNNKEEIKCEVNDKKNEINNQSEQINKKINQEPEVNLIIKEEIVQSKQINLPISSNIPNNNIIEEKVQIQKNPENISKIVSDEQKNVLFKSDRKDILSIQNATRNALKKEGNPPKFNKLGKFATIAVDLENYFSGGSLQKSSNSFEEKKKIEDDFVLFDRVSYKKKPKTMKTMFF